MERQNQEITRAVKQEKSIRLHTCLEIDSTDSYATNNFLGFVKSILPYSKFRLFKRCFDLYVDTISVTEKIFEAFKDIFNAYDSSFFYQFSSTDLNKDWESYRSLKQHESFWKNDFFEAKKHFHNSIIVVDLPVEQTSELPEPYYNVIPIDNVKAVDEGPDGKLNFVIFSLEKGKIAVYDKDAYSIYDIETGKPVLISQFNHELKECPARFITSKSLPKSNIVKKSVFSLFIGKLHWLLFYAIAKRQFDISGPFPIWWSFREDCNYEAEDGSMCVNGFMESPLIGDGDGHLTGPKLPCPKCSNKNYNGPGTHIEIEPPIDKEANLREPGGYIVPDINSLEYVTKQVEELKAELVQSITGNIFEPVNNQAVNEKQVISLFEDRKKKLLNFSEDFNHVRAWADSIACRLRYESGFISCSINYGTQFYLFSEQEMKTLYENALDSNIDTLTLNDLQERYYSTKYKGDAILKSKAMIFLNIDPFRHKSDDQVISMFNMGLISDQDLYLKLNLSSLVTRFERENGPVNEFGILLEFDKRINVITQTIKSYIETGQQDNNNIGAVLNSHGIAV